MTRLLLRGGRVIDPAGSWDGAADLLLVDGRIAGRERPGGFDFVVVCALRFGNSVELNGRFVHCSLHFQHFAEASRKLS